MILVIGAVLIVLVILYISYYYRYPTELNILQTTLHNFTFEMLREKQPIVIQDHVATLASLKSMWFTYNTTIDFGLGASSPNAPLWIRNNYKFVVIQPTEDCELLLTPARDKPDAENIMPEDAAIVAIQAKEGQVFIVPLHMHYAICSDSKKEVCKCIGVHDLITRVLP